MLFLHLDHIEAIDQSVVLTWLNMTVSNLVLFHAVIQYSLRRFSASWKKDITCVQCRNSALWSSDPKALPVNSCLWTEHSSFCVSCTVPLHHSLSTSHCVTRFLWKLVSAAFNFHAYSHVHALIVAFLFLHRSFPHQITEITLCPAEPQHHLGATLPTAPSIVMYPCPLDAGKDHFLFVSTWLQWCFYFCCMHQYIKIGIAIKYTVKYTVILCMR